MSSVRSSSGQGTDKIIPAQLSGGFSQGDVDVSRQSEGLRAPTPRQRTAARVHSELQALSSDVRHLSRNVSKMDTPQQPATSTRTTTMTTTSSTTRVSVPEHSLSAAEVAIGYDPAVHGQYTTIAGDPIGIPSATSSESGGGGGRKRKKKTKADRLIEQEVRALRKELQREKAARFEELGSGMRDNALAIADGKIQARHLDEEGRKKRAELRNEEHEREVKWRTEERERWENEEVRMREVRDRAKASEDMLATSPSHRPVKSRLAPPAAVLKSTTDLASEADSENTVPAPESVLSPADSTLNAVAHAVMAVTIQGNDDDSKDDVTGFQSYYDLQKAELSGVDTSNVPKDAEEVEMETESAPPGQLQDDAVAGVPDLERSGLCEPNVGWHDSDDEKKKEGHGLNASLTLPVDFKREAVSDAPLHLVSAFEEQTSGPGACAPTSLEELFNDAATGSPEGEDMQGFAMDGMDDIILDDGSDPETRQLLASSAKLLEERKVLEMQALQREAQVKEEERLREDQEDELNRQREEKETERERERARRRNTSAKDRATRDGEERQRRWEEIREDERTELTALSTKRSSSRPPKLPSIASSSDEALLPSEGFSIKSPSSVLSGSRRSQSRMAHSRPATQHPPEKSSKESSQASMSSLEHTQTPNSGDESRAKKGQRNKSSRGTRSSSKASVSASASASASATSQDTSRGREELPRTPSKESHTRTPRTAHRRTSSVASHSSKASVSVSISSQEVKRGRREKRTPIREQQGKSATPTRRSRKASISASTSSQEAPQDLKHPREKRTPVRELQGRTASREHRSHSSKATTSSQELSKDTPERKQGMPGRTASHESRSHVSISASTSSQEVTQEQKPREKRTPVRELQGRTSSRESRSHTSISASTSTQEITQEQKRPREKRTPVRELQGRTASRESRSHSSKATTSSQEVTTDTPERKQPREKRTPIRELQGRTSSRESRSHSSIKQSSSEDVPSNRERRTASKEKRKSVRRSRSGKASNALDTDISSPALSSADLVPKDRVLTSTLSSVEGQQRTKSPCFRRSRNTSMPWPGKSERRHSDESVDKANRTPRHTPVRTGNSPPKRDRSPLPCSEEKKRMLQDFAKNREGRGALFNYAELELYYDEVKAKSALTASELAHLKHLEELEKEMLTRQTEQGAQTSEDSTDDTHRPRVFRPNSPLRVPSNEYDSEDAFMYLSKELPPSHSAPNFSPTRSTAYTPHLLETHGSNLSHVHAEAQRRGVVLNLNFTPGGVNMATGDPHDTWNNTPQERSGMATPQVHTRHRSTSPLTLPEVNNTPASTHTRDFLGEVQDTIAERSVPTGRERRGQTSTKGVQTSDKLLDGVREEARSQTPPRKRNHTPQSERKHEKKGREVRKAVDSDTSSEWRTKHTSKRRIRSLSPSSTSHSSYRREGRYGREEKNNVLSGLSSLSSSSVPIGSASKHDTYKDTSSTGSSLPPPPRPTRQGTKGQKREEREWDGSLDERTDERAPSPAEVPKAFQRKTEHATETRVRRGTSHDRREARLSEHNLSSLEGHEHRREESVRRGTIHPSTPNAHNRSRTADPSSRTRHRTGFEEADGHPTTVRRNKGHGHVHRPEVRRELMSDSDGRTHTEQTGLSSSESTATPLNAERRRSAGQSSYSSQYTSADRVVTKRNIQSEIAAIKSETQADLSTSSRADHSFDPLTPLSTAQPSTPLSTARRHKTQPSSLIEAPGRSYSESPPRRRSPSAGIEDFSLPSVGGRVSPTPTKAHGDWRTPDRSTVPEYWDSKDSPPMRAAPHVPSPTPKEKIHQSRNVNANVRMREDIQHIQGGKYAKGKEVHSDHEDERRESPSRIRVRQEMDAQRHKRESPRRTIQARTRVKQARQDAHNDSFGSAFTDEHGNSYVVAVDPESLNELSRSADASFADTSTEGFDAMFDVVVPAFHKNMHGDEPGKDVRTNEQRELGWKGGVAVLPSKFLDKKPAESDDSGLDTEKEFLHQAMQGKVSAPYSGFPRPKVVSEDVVTPVKRATQEGEEQPDAEGTPAAVEPPLRGEHPSGSLRSLYEQHLSIRGSLLTCPDCERDPTQHGFCTATGVPHLAHIQCPYCKKPTQSCKFCPVAGASHEEIANGVKYSHAGSIERMRDTTAAAGFLVPELELPEFDRTNKSSNDGQRTEPAMQQPDISDLSPPTTPSLPGTAADAALEPSVEDLAEPDTLAVSQESQASHVSQASEPQPVITVTVDVPTPIVYADPFDGAEIKFVASSSGAGKTMCYMLDGEARPDFKQMRYQGEKRLFFPDTNRIADLPTTDKLGTLRKICQMAEWAGVEHDVPDVTLQPSPSAHNLNLHRDGSMLYSERTHATSSSSATGEEEGSTASDASGELYSESPRVDSEAMSDLLLQSLKNAHSGVWAKRHSTTEGAVSHLRWVILSEDMTELKWYTKPENADPRQSVSLASTQAVQYQHGSVNGWYQDAEAATKKDPQILPFCRYKFTLLRTEKNIDFTAADRSAWLALRLGIETAIAVRKGHGAPKSAGKALWELACYTYLAFKYNAEGKLNQKYIEYMMKESKEIKFPRRAATKSPPTPQTQLSLDASHLQSEDSVAAARLASSFGTSSVPQATPTAPPAPPAASAAPAAPVPVGEASTGWTCSACTFKNHDFATRCDICATTRPTVRAQEMPLSVNSKTRAPSPGGRGRGAPLARSALLAGTPKGQGGTSPPRGRSRGRALPAALRPA